MFSAVFRGFFCFVVVWKILTVNFKVNVVIQHN